jgi:hypothetical protein
VYTYPMSTRDDEIENEIVREEPEEEVERHTKPHDSYREATTTDDVEDMTQPPLEPQIEELEQELELTMKAVGLTPEVDEAPEEVMEVGKVEDLPRVNDVDPSYGSNVVTQDEILAIKDPVVTNVDIQAEVAHEEIVPEVINNQEVVLPEASTDLQQAGTPQQVEEGGYHTVSGGPETIHDKYVVGKNGTSSDPLNSSQYSSAQAASGYSIPNQNYVAPQPMDLQTQSNFGSFFMLIILAIFGGAISYVYFYMPQTFDQIFDAMVIIKNQLLK